jgi:hypothetical protein
MPSANVERMTVRGSKRGDGDTGALPTPPTPAMPAKHVRAKAGGRQPRLAFVPQAKSWMAAFSSTTQVSSKYRSLGYPVLSPMHGKADLR